MAEARIINIKKKILGKNKQLAQDLRAEFARKASTLPAWSAVPV